MRLIDADVLYQKTEELEKQAREASRQAITEPTQEKWNTILAERSAFKYDITQMPTIDAEPVVRCKDCKHRQELRECPMYHLNYERYEWQLDDDCDDYTKADGFCDRGGRKDDE